jgi:type I restriction enzyme, S subunit
MIALRKQHLRYVKYHDSGVEWLGEIPEKWNIIRLRFLLHSGFFGLKMGPFGSQLKLEDMTDDGYKVYGQENVISNDFSLGHRFISDEKFHELKIYEILPKDVLITMMGTGGRCTIVPENVQDGIMDSHLIRLRPCNNQMKAGLLSFLIDKAPYLRDQIQLLGKGSIMHGLNSSIIKELGVLIPSSINEQNKLTSYLDEKCTLIDSIIAKKQRQMELLKEKRTAVINRAVTRGLDENMEMKEGGVDWIGRIPKGWQRRSLRYCTAYTYAPIKTGPFGSDLKGDDFQYEGEFRVYNQRNVLDDNFDEPALYISNNKFKDLESCEILPNNILITSRGTIGKTATFPPHAARGILHPCLIRIAVNEKVCLPDYLKLILQEAKYIQDQFVLISNATTIDVIYSNTLKATSLLLPPVSEQIEILQHIHQKTAETDRFIQLLDHSLSLLSEYKTSLISHAVTGRIKVLTSPLTHDHKKS